MINGIYAFMTYLAASAAMLVSFIFIYVKFTPYHEFDLIKKNNMAAAIALSGAVLGFTFPMVSSIYYTASLLEMVQWSLITCIVQLLLFILMRRFTKRIESGDVAPAIFLATMSICIGLLNAVSISH